MSTSASRLADIVRVAVSESYKTDGVKLHWGTVTSLDPFTVSVGAAKVQPTCAVPNAAVGTRVIMAVDGTQWVVVGAVGQTFPTLVVSGTSTFNGRTTINGNTTINGTVKVDTGGHDKQLLVDNSYFKVLGPNDTSNLSVGAADYNDWFGFASYSAKQGSTTINGYKTVLGHSGGGVWINGHELKNKDVTSFGGGISSWWCSNGCVTVQVDQNVAAVSAWSEVTIGTIPSGFRPPRNVFSAVARQDTSSPWCAVYVGSDGAVRLHAYGSAVAPSWVRASVTYQTI